MKPLSELDLGRYPGKIFDWDGTLADTIGIWNLTDRHLIDYYTGIDVDLDTIYQDRMEFLKDAKGLDTYTEYANFLREKYEITDSAENIYESRVVVAKQKLIELDYKSGAAEFLASIKQQGKGKMAIASITTERMMQTYRLENEKIRGAANIDEIFDLLVLKDDVEKIKPHPEIYEKTIEKLGFNKKEVIVFEDSLHGVQSAKAAGLTVVNVVDKYSADDQPKIDELADYKAETWHDLNELL